MEKKLSDFEKTLNMHYGTENLDINEFVDYLDDANDNNAQHLKEEFKNLLQFVNGVI